MVRPLIRERRGDVQRPQRLAVEAPAPEHASACVEEMTVNETRERLGATRGTKTQCDCRARVGGHVLHEVVPDIPEVAPCPVLDSTFQRGPGALIVGIGCEPLVNVFPIHASAPADRVEPKSREVWCNSMWAVLHTARKAPDN